MHQNRILFILKRGLNYVSDDHSKCYSHGTKSSGLLNSVKFVVNMLQSHGVPAEYVQVVDNNDIDREVTKFQPTHVVIEALWVVPEKFEVLSQLHPTVRWIVRIHSALPFLSGEGIAIDWLQRYLDVPQVSIASNHKKTYDDLLEIVGQHRHHRVLFLPNFYKLRDPHVKPRLFKAHVDVACFGAIRPLKDQLEQAVAAIRFAEHEGKLLRFHINSTRCEQGGESILKNLRSLFSNSIHKLIEHTWKTHKDFLILLQHMDAGLQVSFSETFNIVAADYVQAGLPMVVSPEIAWASRASTADPTSSRDIAKGMEHVTGFFRRHVYRQNVKGLENYSQDSQRIWLGYFKHHC